MAYLLALDQGTSSSRSILFDHRRQSDRLRATRIHTTFPITGLGRT